MTLHPVPSLGEKLRLKVSRVRGPVPTLEMWQWLVLGPGGVRSGGLPDGRSRRALARGRTQGLALACVPGDLETSVQHSGV